MNLQPHALTGLTSLMSFSATSDNFCTWQLDAETARRAAHQAGAVRAAAAADADTRPNVARRRVRWADVASVMVVIGAAASPLLLMPAAQGDAQAVGAGRIVAVVNPPAR